MKGYSIQIRWHETEARYCAVLLLNGKAIECHRELSLNSALTWVGEWVNKIPEIQWNVMEINLKNKKK